jgi:hypothetical protein
MCGSHFLNPKSAAAAPSAVYNSSESQIAHIYWSLVSVSFFSNSRLKSRLVFLLAEENTVALGHGRLNSIECCLGAVLQNEFISI